MTDSKLYFVAATYFGTGEGMTVATMVTLANPRPNRDYSVEPDFNTDTMEYFPGVLSRTREEIALLEFKEQFSGMIGLCGKVLSQEEFLDKFSPHIPQHVIQFVTDWNKNGPSAGNYRWAGEMHVNYS